MRRTILLAAVLVQIIGTVFLSASRIIDCGERYVQCMQRHAALNIAASATVFLLFWTVFFGVWNRIGALFFSAMFLIVLLIADLAFLADGLTGSRIYTNINIENSYLITGSNFFTPNYFIYNGWLLICTGLAAAALYRTMAELKARTPEYT